MITLPSDFVVENRKKIGQKCLACKGTLNGELIIRKNRDSEKYFVSCTMYPDCKHAERFAIESKDQMKFEF